MPPIKCLNHFIIFYIFLIISDIVNRFHNTVSVLCHEHYIKNGLEISAEVFRWLRRFTAEKPVCYKLTNKESYQHSQYGFQLMHRFSISSSAIFSNELLNVCDFSSLLLSCGPNIPSDLFVTCAFHFWNCIADFSFYNFYLD